jgi:hypothetical protein
MSFIECISAEKVALPPLVIIKESQYSNGGFLLALTATGVMRLQRLCIRALYIIYVVVTNIAIPEWRAPHSGMGTPYKNIRNWL